MAVRPAQMNPALGYPRFGVAYDPPVAIADMRLAPGTITEGYDDVANQTDEYIWMQNTTGGNLNANTEVTYTTAYVPTAVAAGQGQATSPNIVLANNQYAWFKLKRRGVIA